MPSDTADQQITLPVGADVADGPVAFTNQTADLEARLVLRYTDAADRTARHPVGIENQLSGLGTENRMEVFDSANWISLHPRGLFAYIRKTVNEIVNNSATLQNDNELLIALPTAGIFGWESIIFYDSNTTPDIKFAYTIPAGATMHWGIHAVDTTGAGDVQFGSTNGSGVAIACGGLGAGTGIVMAIIHGEITMGGTAGNLQLQWAQNTANASDTTVRARSRMMVWRSS